MTTVAVVTAKDAHPKVTLDMSFHLRIASLCAAMLILAVSGSRLESLSVGAGGFAIGFVVVLAMLSPVLLYWREKGRTTLLEAALLLIWELLIASVGPLLVLVIARTHQPLHDAVFGHADQMLGISVPAIMTCARRHWLGRIVSSSYPLVLPLLAVGAFLPLLASRFLTARRFLLANATAFLIGLALFMVLPAVGPWRYFGFTPGYAQMNCQSFLYALRLPGPYVPTPAAAGIVCFPSFHVIWAVLSAVALWDFRRLRIPALFISAAIVSSTLTTGWHYFSDVLAGFAIAAVSTLVAVRAVRADNRQQEQIE